MVQTRAKCWLFLSYMIAFAAVAGSVAVLVQCSQSSDHLWVGVVSPYSQLVPQGTASLCVMEQHWTNCPAAQHCSEECGCSQVFTAYLVDAAAEAASKQSALTRCVVCRVDSCSAASSWHLGSCCGPSGRKMTQDTQDTAIISYASLPVSSGQHRP